MFTWRVLTRALRFHSKAASSIKPSLVFPLYLLSVFDYAGVVWCSGCELMLCNQTDEMHIMTLSPDGQTILRKSFISPDLRSLHTEEAIVIVLTSQSSLGRLVETMYVNAKHTELKKVSVAVIAIILYCSIVYTYICALNRRQLHIRAWIFPHTCAQSWEPWHITCFQKMLVQWLIEARLGQLSLGGLECTSHFNESK